KPAGRVCIQRRARDGKWRESLHGSAVESDVIVMQTAVAQSQRDEIADTAAGSRRIRIDLAAQDSPAVGRVAIYIDAAASSISGVAVHLAVPYDNLAQARGYVREHAAPGPYSTGYRSIGMQDDM